MPEDNILEIRNLEVRAQTVKGVSELLRIDLNSPCILMVFIRIVTIERLSVAQFHMLIFSRHSRIHIFIK